METHVPVAIMASTSTSRGSSVADKLTSFFQSSLTSSDQEALQELLTDFLDDEEQFEGMCSCFYL